ncbi:AAA family ATPase [Tepidibacillus infernus]|uniref:Carbon monoxide dehydrogenase n=1 Tax=Tepidibacillus decaturensis TaxID=1413211 RepID=A0A135L3C3_9BACI|nr:carbon monoxide dehydrogenase accessory protein CooC [Tepidibacillus decaturensis]KXG43496.1 carbon monoxide dehydrogenase [Tepidibacillus decaturensis]
MLDKGMKIAVSGKGGVGKTSLSSLLAHIFAQEGKQVLAVDADPDANFGTALGFPQDILDKLTTIAEDKKLIKERTGAEPGKTGQVFSLNPRVSDIPEKYAVEHNGIKLMQMGNVVTGGAGCACPENSLLKQLLRHLVVKADDTVIVDMEAGLEHLGRGTAEGVDAFIVVVEPGQRSFQTARAVVKLAQDLGVTKVYAVANKVRSGDEEIIKKSLDFIPILGIMPYDPEVISADLSGAGVFHSAPKSVEFGYKIYERLLEEMTNTEEMAI